MVNRIFRVHFRNLRAVVIGPDLSHRRNLAKGLLRAPLVHQATNEECESERISQEETGGIALRYVNEIASDFPYLVIRLLEVTPSWFWNKLYEGVKVNHVKRMQGMAQSNEIVYVPCRRSRIDYLLLSCLPFCSDPTPPHVAAGVNLNIPVIGSILRCSGAFFMHRGFKGNQFYTAVSSEYLHVLFSRGFPTEYFVKGGRSRTRRIPHPHTGMLAVTLCSFLCNSHRPIVFISVYIGREHVLEGRTYFGELRGATREEKSILDLFKVVGTLKQYFGQVWVNFGEPIHFDQFLDRHQPDWQDRDLGPGYRPGWLPQAASLLTKDVACHLDDMVMINLVGLVALALLSTSRQTPNESVLMRILDLHLASLRKVPCSPSATLPDGDGWALIEHMKNMNLLTEQKDMPGRILYLDEQNAVLAAYYRSNAPHVFALPALIASLFQNNSRIDREQLLRFAHVLYPYLQAGLFIHWGLDELDAVIGQWLAALVEQDLLHQENNIFIRPASSSRQYVLSILLVRSVTRTLQRFYMAVALLLNTRQNALTIEELENLCTVMAQRLSTLYGLNTSELFDKNPFRHFVQTLLDLRVLRKDGAGKLSYHELFGKLTGGVAKCMLPAEIRLSVRQVTLERLAKEAAAESNDTVTT